MKKIVFYNFTYLDTVLCNYFSFF